ncbi:MAG: helix-turn-helix domain-containing protein [Planctomycetota bacterium]|jgi:excisionase family DNA binding protein
MKIEINDSQLVNNIVERVVEQLTPLLAHNSKSEDNKLMTVEELAGYLRVKESWIYDKIYKKEIPFHKCGKFPRFRKRYIDIWLKNPYSSELNKFNLNHRRLMK